jgi:hypothetical protein
MDDEPTRGDQQQQPEYDTRDPEAPIVLHHVPSSSNSADAHHEYNRAQEYSAIAFNWMSRFLVFIWRDVIWNKAFWTFAATVVMAIAAALYTHYASRQLKAINDQLPELQKSAEAAKTSSEISELSQRPWIKIVDLTTIGNNSFIPSLSFQGFGHAPFPGGQKQAAFQTKISLKNVGNSPAFVTVDHELFFPAWKENFEDILRIEQKRFCEASNKRQTAGAVVRVVFPNEPQEWGGAGVQSIDPIVGANAINHTAEDPTGEYVLPAVIVCANYNSRGTKRYQTMALYIIVHKGTGNRFFKIGDGVPERELRIIRDDLADDAY